MPWRASGILKMISNEKYMGDVMMGKSVNIDGKKCDNLDGQYGERYYIEDAHEGIISKETYYKAMELRQQRAAERAKTAPQMKALKRRVEAAEKKIDELPEIEGEPFTDISACRTPPCGHVFVGGFVSSMLFVKNG